MTPKVCRGFASKVRNHCWTGSVQGAVATWSVISMRYFLRILESHSLTRSLPLRCTDPVQVRFLLLRQSRLPAGAGCWLSIYLTRSRGEAARLNGNLFRAVQSLAKRALLFASLDELVRLDDGPRLIRVFNAREIAEPGFLAHRIYISLLAFKAVNYVKRTLEVRPRQPSRAIHLSVNRPAKQ